METYVTEEQQLEAIKNWFKKYGNAISWAITIVCVLAAAVTYWSHHQNVIADQASENYIAMMEGMEKSDVTTVASKADLLLSNYASSPYATLAAFALAFEAVEKHDVEKAKMHLQWVLNSSKQADFKAIARIRLMRLLISEQKLDDALKIYDEKNAFGLLTVMAELKGDILLAQNDLPGAKAAYQTAYHAAPEKGMHGVLLKMKMDDLGIEPEESTETEKAKAEAV